MTKQLIGLIALMITSSACSPSSSPPDSALNLEAAAVGPTTSAEHKRAMTLVDLLEVPYLSDPQLSPDGRQIVYVRADADWGANRRVSRLWRTDVDRGTPVQLTSGATSENSPRWSPDGRQIAFLASRDGSVQIYLIEAAGGEPRILTSHETSVPVPDAHYPRLSNITWSPDGAWIYFLAFEPNTAAEKEREQTKDDVYAFGENHKQRHLWRVSAAKKTEERVTGGDYSVLDYQLSQDGSRIVFHRAPNPRYGYGNEGEIWVMDAGGQHALQLTRNTVPEVSNCCGGGGAQLSPDNRQVVFMAKANQQFDYYYKSSLFVMPASGGTPRLLLPDLPYEVHEVNWSTEGKSLFFVANMGVHSELFQVELATNKLRQLTDGKHAINSWSIQRSANRHVLAFDESTNPGDVWLLPIDGGTATQSTHVFDSLTRDFQLPRQESIRWKGADDVTVEGLLFYPLSYEPRRRYPLVVQSHGGMANSDEFGFGRWSDYVQVLSAKGYAVLKTNYRGSGGYGDAFQRDMIGHYFKNSHLDVLAGVDHVIAIGVADPDRLVKMGWSAGGYMTNKIITFTPRFKAASSGAGMVNWVSFHAESDVNYFRTTWLGGTPWQKNAPIEKIWEQSPLKYISNVTTPTIIFVGEKDVRVPWPQSMELYQALKSNGVSTHLYMAPREPHGWTELRHELFKMNVELEWFERYAVARQYTWERVPSSRGARVTASRH
jgi:dipeptidyl aminopeptidase/acylaminoacyl peptidase